MEKYIYVSGLRIEKGGIILKEKDLCNLSELEIKDLCTKNVIKKLKSKKDVD